MPRSRSARNSPRCPRPKARASRSHTGFPPYAGRYYQQRFEFADSDSDTPLSLDQFLRAAAHATAAERDALGARFGIAGLLDQPFMTLSNGQTRRARLARAMLAKPELL